MILGPNHNESKLSDFIKEQFEEGKSDKEVLDSLLNRNAHSIEDLNLSLIRASQYGLTACVQALLRKGASINYGPEANGVKDYTALYLAAQNGHADTVLVLLQNGAEKNKRISLRHAPLIIATINNHTEVVRILLKYHADPNLINKKGRNASHIASIKGFLEIVEMFIEDGRVEFNWPDNEGFTPLHCAVFCGHIDIVKALSACKAVLLDKPSMNNLEKSSLHLTIQKNYPDMVVALLEAGSFVNNPDINGSAPLWDASALGCEQIIKILLKYGASVTQTGKAGTSPLYIAAQNGYDKIVTILLKYGADVNQPRKGGATPLFIASENGHEKTIKILLEHGASVNNALDDARTSLHLACAEGHLMIVKVLLKYGASLNLTTNDSCSPLRIAAEKKHIEIVKFLLQHGATIDEQEEWCIEYIKSISKHLDVVELLLAAKPSLHKALDEEILEEIMRLRFNNYVANSCLMMSCPFLPFELRGMVLDNLHPISNIATYNHQQKPKTLLLRYAEIFYEQYNKKSEQGADEESLVEDIEASLRDMRLS